MSEASVTGEPSRPRESGNLRERVEEVLRADIRSGTLAPGSVCSVPALATRFGVSATPVREAMLDLVKDGLVEALPNRGFRVVVIDPEELRQVAEVRLMLEPPALAELAGRLTFDQLTVLRRQVDAITRAAEQGDHDSAAQAAWAFRDTLLELCPNRVLVAVIGRLRDRSRPSGIRTDVDYAKFARTQHALVDSLAAGDGAKVRRTVEYDIIRFSPPRRVASQA